MKKTVFIILASCLAVFSASAQVDDNALGIRVGGGNFSGVEFSYQRGLSDANRLEFDLGIGSNKHFSGIGLSGIYQWVWPIGGEGFNWFAGPGAGLALYNGKGDNDDFVGLSLGGQIGVGYSFKIPLQLTIDTRPMFDIMADSDAFGWGLALGIRYRF